MQGILNFYQSIYDFTLVHYSQLRTYVHCAMCILNDEQSKQIFDISLALIKMEDTLVATS